MRGLSKVILIGNLGKIPDIQALEGGTKVAKMSLATTEACKDNKGQPHYNTEWYTVVFVAKFGRVSGYLFAERKLDKPK